MAWIESHQELAGHPKTKKLARKLNVSVPATIGYLHCLWWWAMDYAQEGRLGRYEPDDIADAMMWEGESDLLISSLVEVGFLDETEDGLHIHDWDEYAGRLIEQKKFYAERKKRNRQLYDDVDLTRKVRSRDGDNCRYCGKKVNWKDRKGTDGGTYDHIDPEGPNTESNIVVACRSCNSGKGRRTPEEASMHLLPVGKSQVENPPGTYQKPAIPNLTKPNQTKPKEKKKEMVAFAPLVRMTQDEFTGLVEKLGEPLAKDYIERLNGYMGSTGKKYKSHYLTILNWHRNDLEKVGHSPAQQNNGPPNEPKGWDALRNA